MEAVQLVIDKHERGVGVEFTEKQLPVSLVVRAGLEPATSGFHVQPFNHSVTLLLKLP